MTDAIDPDHYKGFSNGAQVIDITENLTSNASSRLDGRNKGDRIEDLTKAAWFIHREVQRLAEIELAADKAKAAGLDEPELFATWQDVPDGVFFESAGPSPIVFRREGNVLYNLGTGAEFVHKPLAVEHSVLKDDGPFVRAARR